MENKNENDLLLSLFRRCLNAKYIHIEENSADYALEEDDHGKTLFIFFQWSNGKEDWKNNFDFAAEPYKDMDIPWKCHRGFLRVWKTIEPYIKDDILNLKYSKIRVVGFSHGAAIATLAHEYVWFNRPDLRQKTNENDWGLMSYGFGCPRVFFGRMSKKLKERWLTFAPIRNINDIVTHVPPVLFGYRHVTSVVKIGEKGKLIRYRWLDCVSAHYPKNYELSLGADRE